MLASAALLAVRNTRQRPRARRVSSPRCAKGWRFTASVRAMLAATTGYLAMGPMTVLLPAGEHAPRPRRTAARRLPRRAGAGADRGGLLALALTRRAHHGRSILATGVAGIALASLGLVGTAGAALALLATVGMAGGLALSLIVAGIQAQALVALRGRIVSLYTIVSQVPVASRRRRRRVGAGLRRRHCAAIRWRAVVAGDGCQRRVDARAANAPLG